MQNLASAGLSAWQLLHFIVLKALFFERDYRLFPPEQAPTLARQKNEKNALSA
jgi:hypothetical protein